LIFETLEGMVEYGWAPYFGIQKGWLKYIHGAEPEMYDLQADYLELKDLLKKTPGAGESLHAELAAFYGGDLEAAGTLQNVQQLSSEDLSKLQALGYVFGGAGKGIDVSERLNPREYLPLLFEVNQAFEPGKEQWIEKGIEKVEKIVEEHPDFYVAFKELGVAYAKVGRLDKAEQMFRACLELRPDLLVVKCHLAKVRCDQGFFDDAITLYREVIQEVPDDGLSLARLGALLIERKEFKEAAVLLARARRVMPRDPDVVLGLTQALVGLGRTSEAIQELEKVLAENPSAMRVRTQLSRLLRDERRYAEAVEVLRRGVELHPERHDMPVNLAINLTEWTDPSGMRQREAVEILERVNVETNRSDPSFLHALARAYAATGRLSEAVAMSQTARTMAANAGQVKLAGMIDRDLSRHFGAAPGQQPADAASIGEPLPDAQVAEPAQSTNGL
jgi:tetratricopeptide (TPR) repeat protein